MKLKSVIIPLLMLVLCILLLSKWTYGFKAFTIFSYTLEKAQPKTKKIPRIQLLNQDRIPLDLYTIDKYKLVNFIYLNCPFVCHKVNNQLEEIYHLMDSSGILSQIGVITISFDLQNDNVERIRNYRAHFDDISGWDFAIPTQTNKKDFNGFLNDIGVWINKSSENGIINHSTNLYLISPENKIIELFDPNRESNQTILTKIQRCLDNQKITSLY